MLLDQLSFDQKRFVIARQEYMTDREAAEAIGIRSNLPAEWKCRGAPIDQVLDLMVHDGIVMALHLRRKALAKAMAIKAGGLDSNDERVRQGAASELIEWEMGKATQRSEVSGQVTVIWNEGHTSPFGLRPEVDSETG